MTTHLRLQPVKAELKNRADRHRGRKARTKGRTVSKGKAKLFLFLLSNLTSLKTRLLNWPKTKPMNHLLSKSIVLQLSLQFRRLMISTEASSERDSLRAMALSQGKQGCPELVNIPSLQIDSSVKFSRRHREIMYCSHNRMNN